MSRALRRERRGEEHARKDSRRHPHARRRARCSSTDARCASTARATRSPPAWAWCTRSSRSATTSPSPRTSASARFPTRRGFVDRDAMSVARDDDARRDRRASSTCTRRLGELTIAQQQMVQIAVGRRRRRAHHRVRRADEQPQSGRSRSAVRADRPAQGARRDVHLRLAPHAGGLSAVRHGHRAARRTPRRDAAVGASCRRRSSCS